MTYKQLHSDIDEDVIPGFNITYHEDAWRDGSQEELEGMAALSDFAAGLRYLHFGAFAYADLYLWLSC